MIELLKKSFFDRFKDIRQVAVDNNDTLVRANLSDLEKILSIIHVETITKNELTPLDYT